MKIVSAVRTPVGLPILLQIVASLAAMMVAVGISGCEATSTRAARVSPPSLEARQLSTRRFDNVSETQLLLACTAVLQDLGFIVEASESELGVLVASQEQSAHDSGQAIFAALLLILFEVHMEIDETQRLRASLVTTPIDAVADSHRVRITFQRIVRDSSNNVVLRESLREPALYQQFFDRLLKSVFLEAHSL